MSEIFSLGGLLLIGSLQVLFFISKHPAISVYYDPGLLPLV
jgi:hypothetical protein